MKFRSIPFLFYSNYHFRSNYLCSLHVNAQLSTMCSFTNQSLDQPSTYHQESLQFHQHLDHHTNPHTTKKIFSWLVGTFIFRLQSNPANLKRWGHLFQSLKMLFNSYIFPGKTYPSMKDLLNLLNRIPAVKI